MRRPYFLTVRPVSGCWDEALFGARPPPSFPEANPARDTGGAK
jgi:hypothetical protein